MEFCFVLHGPNGDQDVRIDSQTGDVIFKHGPAGIVILDGLNYPAEGAIPPQPPSQEFISRQNDVYSRLAAGTLKLNHYSSISKVRDLILPARTIQFSAYTSLNDPYEEMQWDLPLFAQHSSPEPGEPIAINAAINRVKHNYKVACFTIDCTDPNEDGNSGWSHPRMWDQYGGKHDGAVLIFDGKTLAQEAARTICPKNSVLNGYLIHYDEDFHSAFSKLVVNYDDWKQSDFQDYMERYLGRAGASLFGTKHSDWRHEHEFRLMFLDDLPQSPKYASIENNLDEIVLGQKVSKSDAEAIASLLANFPRTVNLSVCRWRNGRAHKIPAALQFGWATDTMAPAK